LKIMEAGKYCGSIELEGIKKVWEDSLRLGKALEIPDYQKLLKNCAGLSELMQMHDSWVKEFIKQEEKLKAKLLKNAKPFPPPPFEGNQDIRPITSAFELHEEGRDMEHCVGVMTELAYHEDVCFYSVFTPERGTLLLVKRDDQWIIDEFSLSQNRFPSKESWKTVREWLGNV